jgi:regulator of cell morphogenesis and NO signaling
MANKSYTDTINEIVSTHHKYLQSEMPGIAKLSSTILRVHGREHKELRDVHRLFNNTKTVLEQILIIKEVDIFPYIKMYERKPSKELLEEIIPNLRELDKDYMEIEDNLKELREITNDYTPPDDGCETYDKTFEKLEEFDKIVLENIKVERDLFSGLR